MTKRFDSHPAEWIRSWVVALVKEEVCKNHPSKDERLPHVCEVRVKTRLDDHNPSKRCVAQGGDARSCA